MQDLRAARLGLVIALAIAPAEAGAYQITGRWSSTVLNGSVGPRGNPVMLTWSIVDDGTPISQGGNTNGSNLVSWLDDMFNFAPPAVASDDYRSRPWFFLFQDSFDRLSELAGVTYIYEPNDDAVVTGTSGAYARRGDVRVTGKSLGDGSNSLAVNFFPNHSDMVINTDKTSFFDNTPNNYRGFRNVIMHEAMHGLGITHVESSNGAFLMDPIIQTQFDGPQLDEVLALHRNYGDRFEKSGNDSAGGATILPSLAAGGSARVGQFGSRTRVEASQTDFVSIDGTSDVDYFRLNLTQDVRLSLGVLPQGVMYNQGPQDGTEAPFDARAQSDLSLTLFGTDGTTLLHQVNASGLGAGEFLGRLATAGTYYVRVAGGQDLVQLYDLQVSAAPFTTNLVWKGGVSNDWNVGAAPTFTAENVPTSFFNQDAVSFIDNQAPKIVDITQAVSPTSILVDTAGRYIFQGPGSITSGSLTMQGGGELELALSGNTYAGPTLVLGGQLLISGTANAMVSPITVSSGATLLMDAVDASSMSSTFTIEPGGTLAIGRPTSNGNVFPDTPTLLLNNGEIRMVDEERVANLSGVGSLIVESEQTTLSGDNSFTGGVTVLSGATLRGTSTLPGSILVTGNGHLEPGEGLGTLAANQLSLEAGATLAIEIGGIEPGSFDQLSILQHANLAGLLDVSLVDGFIPSAGSVFEILTSASVAGSFSDFSFPTLPSQLKWSIAYEPSSVRLAVVDASPAADFDSDGDVDGADFLAWQLGGSPEPLSSIDIASWQASFGKSAPLSTGFVPEPTTGLLFALSVLAVCLHGRSRN